MPEQVHLYVFDGYADWEPAHAVAAIHNPQFQRAPGRWQVRCVAERAQPLRSMGGVAVLPDACIDALDPAASRLLLLPGGPGWEDAGAHRAALAKALEFLAAGVPVAAICGATAGLARSGCLDDREHTSNAASYLRGTGYGGGAHYREQPAVRAAGLITAGGMAPLEFAREILAELAVYDDEALDAWYQLYKTGKSEYFARFARAAQDC